MASRTNPFSELERFFDRMSEQFERSSGDWEMGWNALPGRSMAVDLADHDDEYVLEADLPGFEKDDIDVRITDHTLHIEAEREEATETESENYVRRERSHRATSRSITLPSEVETDGIEATYDAGVLRVTVPKAEPLSESHRIDVN
jgi:HSP20 family protein